MQVERSTTIGGRVNEDELARVDAAARLVRQPRAHFIVTASLDRADAVLRRAVSGTRPEPTRQQIAAT